MKQARDFGGHIAQKSFTLEKRFFFGGGGGFKIKGKNKKKFSGK